MKLILQPIWRKVIGNSVPLLAVRVISKLATIAVMVFAARGLGKSAFGIYSTILAVTSLSGVLSDFGLVFPTIRSIAKRDVGEQQEVAATFSARLFWSITALSATVIAGIVLQIPMFVILLFAVSSILDVSATALIRSFEGKQEMNTVTLYTFVERAVFCALVLGALWSFGTLEAIAVATCISYGLMFFFALLLFQKRFGFLQLYFSRKSLKEYTVIGLPFFITVVCSVVYDKADTLLLSMFRSNSEVGIYNAAMRVIEAQLFIPLTMMATILPALSRLHHDADPAFVTVLKRSFVIFGAIGLLIAIFLFTTAPILVPMLFSSSYQDAAAVLQVLSLMLTFYFINYLVFQSFIAIHKEIIFTGIMFFSAAASIVGNIIVIPRYGYLGAAWMRVLIETLSCVAATLILIWEVRRRDSPMQRG